VAALSRERGFDRLARPYRLLEFLAFGRDLERARFRYINELRACRRILILGEGDGRFLTRLLGIAQSAQIRCVDRSAAMIALAAKRCAATGGADRVDFERSDVLGVQLDPLAYDAVATLFFLDCFTADEVAAIIAKVRPAMAPGARWLFADFAVPAMGVPRWRARFWLGLLYRFFAWTTDLSARELPPSEEMLGASGLRPVAGATFQAGLLRTVVFDSPTTDSAV
jgi:ubiquinone/menaquinone biosynthesis C-methylase UbiE